MAQVMLRRARPRRRGAPGRRVPDRPAPADVAWSPSAATTPMPGVIRQFADAGRHRGAAQDAVPADAGRHRRGGPGHADAVEGRPPVGGLRPHLQRADARLRRRARLPPAKRRSAALESGRPADLDRRRAVARPRGLSAPLPGERRRRPRSTATSAWPATSSHDEVHLLLDRRGDAWELAVVALDKPHLFSNICGTLAFCGMDILRGSAMTSRGGLVLDIFQFTDGEHFFDRNADGPARFEALLQEVVAGREDVAARCWREGDGAAAPPDAGARGAGDPRRQRAVADLHRARARGAGRAGAAPPRQPRRVGPRLRRRPRADLDGRQQRDRRVPPHSSRRPSCRGRFSRAQGRPRALLQEGS